MTTSTTPFTLPPALAADLGQVQTYWHNLLRGSAETPFADDLSLEDLPELKDRIVLIEAFARPERFRIAFIGEKIAASQPKSLNGKFLDEVDLPYPFEFLRSQSSATVESGHPTHFDKATDRQHGHPAYERLVLPLWGDGHISLLLVAFHGL